MTTASTKSTRPANLVLSTEAFDRPTRVDSPTIDCLAAEMRAANRAELVHYAGASYHDEVAWELCVAWMADRTATEPTLKSRALKAAYGWDLTPEQCTH